MSEKNRIIWEATHSGENINKAHVRVNDYLQGYIQDLCVANLTLSQTLRHRHDPAMPTPTQKVVFKLINKRSVRSEL